MYNFSQDLDRKAWKITFFELIHLLFYFILLQWYTIFHKIWINIYIYEYEFYLTNSPFILFHFLTMISYNDIQDMNRYTYVIYEYCYSNEWKAWKTFENCSN